MYTWAAAPVLPSGVWGSVTQQSTTQQPGQEVLYRRWRPQTFSDVVGQDPVTTTLRNAIASGSPAHAYLLTGPRGTGKTSTGRILAKAVNCESPVDGEPDTSCVSCHAFATGRALDLIELDAASNRGIDEVRALRESVGYAPNSARYKVYLVDEVHMLTDAAFNALLKTLEEPPPHVIFILATTEPHRIPATIISRCQRFDFRRVALDSMVDYLRRVAEGEGIEVEAGGLELIAREATGSLRDATNLLDQLRAYHGSKLSLDTVRTGLGLVVDDRTGTLAAAAVERDLAAGLSLLGAARDDGVDVRAFLRATVNTLRAVLMMKAGAGGDIGTGQEEEMRALAERSDSRDIVAALRALGEVDFRGDAYDSLPAEIAFASLAVGLSAEVRSTAPEPATPGPATAEPATTASAAPVARPRTPEAPAPRADGPRQRERREERPPEPVPPQPQRAAPARPEPAPPRQRGTTSRGRGSQPPAVPADAQQSEELTALRDRWDEIREQARARNDRAGAILNSVWQFKRVEGDTIEIGFRFPNHVDLVRTLDDGKVMAAIRDVVSDTVGRPVQVSPVLWEALEQAAPRPPATTPGSADPGGEPVAAAPASRSGAGGHLLEEAQRLGAVRMEPDAGDAD